MSRPLSYAPLTCCACHTGTVPPRRCTAVLCGCLPYHRRVPLSRSDTLPSRVSSCCRSHILSCRVSGSSPACRRSRHRCSGCPRWFPPPAGSLVPSGSCPHRRRILCTGYRFSHAFWCRLRCTHTLLSSYRCPTLHGYCLQGTIRFLGRSGTPSLSLSQRYSA